MERILIFGKSGSGNAAVGFALLGMRKVLRRETKDPLLPYLIKSTNSVVN